MLQGSLSLCDKVGASPGRLPSDGRHDMFPGITAPVMNKWARSKKEHLEHRRVSKSKGAPLGRAVKLHGALAGNGGRYWTRTSDPVNVNDVL